MDLIKYTGRIRTLDGMIRRRGTGTPLECARKLGMSERALYEVITQLKELFEMPIEYCRERKSYYYTRPGKLEMKFRPEGE